MELERVVALTAFVNLAIALVNLQTAKVNSKKSKENEKDTTSKKQRPKQNLKTKVKASTLSLHIKYK